MVQADGAPERLALQRSFCGVGSAGLALGVSAAEEAEAEAVARARADPRHGAADYPLCWGFGQAWPGGLLSWGDGGFSSGASQRQRKVTGLATRCTASVARQFELLVTDGGTL